MKQQLIDLLNQAEKKILEAKEVGVKSLELASLLAQGAKLIEDSDAITQQAIQMVSMLPDDANPDSLIPALQAQIVDLQAQLASKEELLQKDEAKIAAIKAALEG